MKATPNTPRILHLPRHFLIGVVRLYQGLLSPILHGLSGPHSGCRFHPSCSQYAVDTLRQFGVIRGFPLVSWRLLRCGPWSKGGFDPVPEAQEGDSREARSHGQKAAHAKPCHSHPHHKPSHG